MEWRDESGGGLIELVMVMALMLLFGFTIFSLIYTGSETLRKMDEQKTAQIDARIAMSYLNVRLRQADGAGQIQVKENSLNGEDSIVIKYIDEDPSMNYDTWVFFDEGYLQEVIAEPGADPEWLGASPIAEIDSLKLDINEKVLSYEIGYDYGRARRVMKSRTALRSREALSD
ncbi:MAG: DUF4860 domain-containing protein [Clostridiales bacterium]|jgi:hypothetical protein|nr:DUF4860 domain-containing protein [Clostridiales bacterium]MDR2752043.1 DUF4860 domain-containing protein [Clostridiales bacterium]